MLLYQYKATVVNKNSLRKNQSIRFKNIVRNKNKQMFGNLLISLWQSPIRALSRKVCLSKIPKLTWVNLMKDKYQLNNRLKYKRVAQMIQESIN